MAGVNESRFLDGHNVSQAEWTDDLELFLQCWSKQSCDECLSSTHPCSWCPMSYACVPNTKAQFPFQILAPIKYEDICPMNFRERWELRAKPFGCQCSTMTLMSTVIAVLGTLVGIFAIWLFVKLLRGCFRGWRGRDRDLWQRRWRRVVVVRADHDSERRPLLTE